MNNSNNNMGNSSNNLNNPTFLTGLNTSNSKSNMKPSNDDYLFNSNYLTGNERH